jgi:hypothetical protein
MEVQVSQCSQGSVQQGVKFRPYPKLNVMNTHCHSQVLSMGKSSHVTRTAELSAKIPQDFGSPRHHQSAAALTTWHHGASWMSPTPCDQLWGPAVWYLLQNIRQGHSTQDASAACLPPWAQPGQETAAVTHGPPPENCPTETHRVRA